MVDGKDLNVKYHVEATGQVNLIGEEEQDELAADIEDPLVSLSVTMLRCKALDPTAANTLLRQRHLPIDLAHSEIPRRCTSTTSPSSSQPLPSPSPPPFLSQLARLNPVPKLQDKAKSAVTKAASKSDCSVVLVTLDFAIARWIRDRDE
ncbi:unnamed protein product [Zymoseptoria tritici ST99CH_1E4]|uniref:Uncharacterized protein n=1 Tax=Zymoseptoria tritici ST99CH_1E4 TaxID=1276532 RepID=A0A2H1FJ16_ZYMTR|nr:unnamed protein product [Zymoseptoria tritici ST99CH_1E4]